MKIPFLALKSQFEKIEPDIRAAIDRVLNSQRFIMGPEVEKLEESIANITETRSAIGVSSGSDALLCSLMAADIEPGDEVIVTSFSFFATAGCIVRMFATPVFVDIDPVTYNVDPQAIADAITEKTKAIVVVHLFGQCADMDPINEIAARHGLIVVEDAAQSLCSKYKEQLAGSLGDVGCFSFFPSKNLGACGDGGMIVSRNRELGEKCRLIRQHGSSPKYHHPVLGGNFRLDAMQAAILNAKLPYLKEWNSARCRNAEIYNELFAGTDVQVPQIADYNETVFHQYVVRVKNRDQVRNRLQKAGVPTEVYYPEPLHLQPCLAYLGYKQGDLPVSEQAAAEVLALPIYPELTEEVQTYIAQQLIEAVKETSGVELAAVV